MLTRPYHMRAARLLALLAALLLAAPSFARSFIRDAELEHTLRRMSDPIFAAADIEPSAVRLFIINDPAVNAYVAGGQNIFFHTGLLLKAENPAMLMGVIAHETGHIAGAHLSQLSGAADDAALGALLSTILGAAAVLGGSPDAGSAILSAGQNSALRNLLSFYRGNEQQADQAAVRYLRAVNLSPAGMLDMFELLRRQERQHIGPGGNAYLRTHPLTTDRIAALRGEVRRHTDLPARPPEAIETAFARMQAKLLAFLSQPEQTFRRYPESETSQAAHLARAVAWFRTPDLPAALREVDALIALSPDAFAYDLKGQILYEHGRVEEAIAAYRKAHERAPGIGLILSELGKAYLASEQAHYLPEAVRALERSVRLDDSHAATYRLLARAYGKQGRLGASYLSLAREAALQHEPDTVIRYAGEAKAHLEQDSALALQADDLIADARRIQEEK